MSISQDTPQIEDRKETEIDPGTVEGIQAISLAGEEVYIDAMGYYPSSYYDLEAGTVHPQVHTLADEYESFTQLLQEYEAVVTDGQVLTDESVEAMQAAYDRLRLLRNEAQHIQRTQEILPETAEVVEEESVEETPPTSLDVEPRIPEVIPLRRRTLAPEPLDDADDSVPIHVVVPTPPPAPPRPKPSIQDTQTPVPKSAPKNVEHTAPQQQPTPLPARERTRFEVDRGAQQQLRRRITQIEAAGIDRIDVWLGDAVSPYEVLGRLPFTEVYAWAQLPYAELQEQLNEYRVTYRSFDVWVSRFDEMQHAVESTKQLTFKDVVDYYVEHLIRSQS